MMEIQSEWWKLEVMIIPSKSREIHTVSHYKTPTLHPHSKENQNRITQQPSIVQRNTHRKTLSHRLQSPNHHKTPLHSTIPSQQMQPPNRILFPSQTSQWTQISTSIKSTPPKHSSMQCPSHNKHTPSLLERIERVTRITPPTYHDQECTWRCYQRAPACRSVSSPRTPHGSTS